TTGERARSAPVPGRSKHRTTDRIGLLASHSTLNDAAPGDGRTPGALSVRKGFFVLRERLVDGLGRPNEGDHTNQVRGRQHHGSQAKARDRSQALQRFSERSKDEHAKGRDVTAD